MFKVLWVPVILFVVVAVIALGYTLATYLVRRYDQRLARAGTLSPGYGDPREMPMGWRKWKGIAHEVFSTLTFIWLYPLGKWGKRTKHPSKQKGWGRPILLIHGYNHNRSGWFKFRRRLIKAGLGPVYAFNLPPRNRTIEKLAESIATEIDLIRRQTGKDEVILIGHSMGGLVAAYYAEYLASPHSVSHVVTLGSPLHGTRSAVLAGTPAAKQMRTGSEFVQKMTASISSSSKAQYFHLASRLDNIILPYHSSLIGVTPENECLITDLGHMSLLFSHRVTHQVIQWLKRAVPEYQPVAETEPKVSRAVPNPIA